VMIVVMMMVMMTEMMVVGSGCQFRGLDYVCLDHRIRCVLSGRLVICPGIPIMP